MEDVEDTKGLSNPNKLNAGDKTTSEKLHQTWCDNWHQSCNDL